LSRLGVLEFSLGALGEISDVLGKFTAFHFFVNFLPSVFLSFPYFSAAFSLCLFFIASESTSVENLWFMEDIVPFGITLCDISPIGNNSGALSHAN